MKGLYGEQIKAPRIEEAGCSKGQDYRPEANDERPCCIVRSATGSMNSMQNMARSVMKSTPLMSTK
jgi:hypothetical protein